MPCISSACFSSPVIRGSSYVPSSVAAVTTFAAFHQGVQSRQSTLLRRSALNHRLNRRALPSRDVHIARALRTISIVGCVSSIRVVKPVCRRQSEFRTYRLWSSTTRKIRIIPLSHQRVPSSRLKGRNQFHVDRCLLLSSSVTLRQISYIDLSGIQPP